MQLIVPRPWAVLIDTSPMSDQNHDNDGRYDKIDATETSNSKVDNTDRDKDDNKSNKDRDESIDDRRRGREKESRDSRRKDREDSRDGRRRGRDDESRDSRRVDVSRDDRRRGRDDSRDRRDRSRRDRSLSRDKGRRSRDDSRDRRRRSPSPVSRRGSSRRSRSADRKSRRSRTRSRSIPKVEEPAKTIVPLKSNKFWDGFQWVDRTPLTAAIAPNAKSESDEAAAAALISSSIGQKDRRIYVGNLPAGVSHEMIKEFSKLPFLFWDMITLLLVLPSRMFHHFV